MKTGLILLIASAAIAAGASGGGKPAPIGARTLKTIRRNYAPFVEPIFAKKCFDCHSAKTNYPWYHRVPLVKTMIDLDIAKARRLLDMTGGFPFNGLGTLEERFGLIREEVATGDMPPLAYRLFHSGSKLTKDDQAVLLAWLDGKASLGATGTGAPATK